MRIKQKFIFSLLLISTGKVLPKDVVEDFTWSRSQYSHPNATIDSLYDCFNDGIKGYISHHKYRNLIQRTTHAHQRYTAAQFKHYFDELRYTEQQILNQQHLYLSNEFVKLAQTYSGYEQTIKRLHKELTTLSNYKKFFRTLTGTYYPGLKKRIQTLYNEICTQQQVQQNTLLNNQCSSSQLQKIPHHNEKSDHKELVKSFMALDVEKATATILENNNSYESVAHEMSNLAQRVFVNARHCNMNFLPKIESHVYNSIDAMKIAQDHPTFIFNFSMINHTLGDLQQLSHAILSGRHPILERSSELLIRGFDKFFKGLNPLTQASNMGHLACDLGSLLKRGGSALWNDPIAVVHNGITSVFTLTELIRNTAEFTSDLTVGKLYLSPEEYKQRTDAFFTMMEPLQGVTAEQCTDFAAQLAADVVFFKGLAGAYNFLKEIDVLSKLGESAAAAARTFKKGFDTHLANNPIMVTAEGTTIKMSNDLKNVGEKIKNSSIGQKIILRIANMQEFFQLPFGKTLHPHSLKTPYHYQSCSIYKLTKDIPGTELKEGYFYYLDRLHRDHLEIFNKKLKAIAVYNLDGTLNEKKLEAAKKAGRNITKLMK